MIKENLIFPFTHSESKISLDINREITKLIQDQQGKLAMNAELECLLNQLFEKGRKKQVGNFWFGKLFIMDNICNTEM
jgi:hypothetical protein